MTDHSCCEAKQESPKPWHQNLTLWMLLLLGVLLLGSFIFHPLLSFRDSFVSYLKMMFLPLTLGFFLGGLIDYYIPREYVSKHLASSHKRTVFYAAGLGFLMSACNHGILALSMELHKKGASGPAVISFLLASPWANLPITILLIGFFKWRGIVLILTALAIAMVTGLIFQILEKKEWIEKNTHAVKVVEGFSIRKDIRARFKNYVWSFKNLKQDAVGIVRGIYELSEMVFSWILFGMVLASLSAAFVPPHFFHKFLGPSLGGLALTIVFSAVIEVCSEGTSPIAFEIYKQTGAFGNAFSFLMGGVVTDYTEIGLIWKNLGPKTAFWMIAITLPQVIIWGWIFNQIL